MRSSIGLSSLVLYLLGAVILVLLSASTAYSSPFERTENRTPCTDYKPLKQPLFGDLHVHTSYSHDSYVSNQRNDPFAAYRYAKGETIQLPDTSGAQTFQATIDRPLDFTAITDHGEYLGLVNMCTQDPWKLGYWWPHCIMTRADNMWLQLVAANRYGVLGGSGGDGHMTSMACRLSDCEVTTGFAASNSHTDTYFVLGDDPGSIINYGLTVEVTAMGLVTNVQTTFVPFFGKSFDLEDGDSHTFNWTNETITFVQGFEIPSTQAISRTTTYIGREQVTVPAGTYDTCRMEETGTLDGMGDAATTNWWGVGSGVLIKSTSDGTTTELISATVNGTGI